MPEVAVKERWTVQLPSLDNLEELDSFCEYLTAHTDKRGVKRLLSQLQKHRKHVNLVTAFAKRAQKTAGYINGIRVRSDGNNNLKKTGLLVFSVPNIRSFEYFFYKKIGKRFPGFIDEHIYYFTPHSISIILKNQGFTIKKITSRHYSTIHFPSRRPLVGWITFPVKLLLEYTQFGGSFKIGNLLYVYAEKDEKKN